MSEYADWLDEILIFGWMKHKWLIFIFDLFSLMDSKLFVKMKLSAKFSFGIKLWDTFFYFPREFDVGEFEVLSIYPGSLMQGHPWFLNFPTIFRLWFPSDSFDRVHVLTELVVSIKFPSLTECLQLLSWLVMYLLSYIVHRVPIELQMMSSFFVN